MGYFPFPGGYIYQVYTQLPSVESDQKFSGDFKSVDWESELTTSINGLGIYVGT